MQKESRENYQHFVSPEEQLTVVKAQARSESDIDGKIHITELGKLSNRADVTWELDYNLQYIVSSGILESFQAIVRPKDR